MQESNWRERAACRGTDVELFYSELESDIRLALSICAGCEVRLACHDHAMRAREAFGIWGGTPERQRRRMIRGRRHPGGAAAPAA
jgi:WhiB family redox-sensing transcriptional regulator